MKGTRVAEHDEDTPRAPGFYQPLPDPQSLEALEARAHHGRLLVKRVSHLVAAIAAVLVLVNLLNTATDSALSLTLRAWSLIPVLVMGSLLAVLFANAHWARSRALEAQRVLIANRRRHSHELQVQAAETRIAARLERLLAYTFILLGQ